MTDQPQQPQQPHAHQPYPPANPVGYTQPPPFQQPYPHYPQAPMHAPPPPPVRGTNFGVALAASVVWPVALVALILTVYGAPDQAQAFGRLVGFLTVPWLITALVTWAIFRKKRVNFFLVMLTALPFFFLLVGFIAAGSSHR